MANLFHIYIRPKPSIKQEEVEAILNKALDWFRYDRGLYILYTTTDVKIWYARLKPLATPGGRVLILPIDWREQHYGWMGKNLWPWLKEKQEKMEQKPGGDQP